MKKKLILFVLSLLVDLKAGNLFRLLSKEKKQQNPLSNLKIQNAFQILLFKT